MKRILHVPYKARTFVVGDVHGCAEELESLLERARFRSGRDSLVLCGDLIDRGPDPARVIEVARRHNAIAVLGNHEEKHLRYRRKDEAARKMMPMPHPSTHMALSDADFEWMAQMPLSLSLGDKVTVVHGGFCRDVPRTRPDLRACRVRYVSTQTGNYRALSDGISRPPDSVHWTEMYRGRKPVIYGHHSYLEASWAQNGRSAWTLGLDTGCCFGGSLTGYWVGREEIVVQPSLSRVRSASAVFQRPRYAPY